MNFEKINEYTTTMLRKTKFVLRKNAPEILIATGVVGIVTSAVMACVASTKVKDTVEEAKDIIDSAHENIEANHLDEKESRREIVIAYAKAGSIIIKPYIFPVALGTVSIGSIVGSNMISRKRNATLAATCTMLDKSFKDYRERIVDRFGEEVDKEARYGVNTYKTENVVVDPNTGKKKKIKEEVKACDHNLPNDTWDRFFDEANINWKKNADLNQMFIERNRQYANKLLKRDGYVMLNDVYDLLGCDKSVDGYSVGWVYDPENPEKIDFGIYTVNRQRSENFIDGYERSVILSFNVDGYILDKIPLRKY